MTRWPRLACARIGSVRYLNARPLIHCFDGPVVVEHPSLLAEQLRAGLLDVALAPIYDGLTSTDYLFVDGVAIGSDGPVFSVVLAYQGGLQEIRSVVVDPASATSVRLLQIILAEFHQLRPAFSPSGSDSLATDPARARLLIGNQAIEFRRTHSHDYRFLDLGEEWQRTIGLPFVYAVWMMPRTMEHGAEIADELRELKDAGLSRLDEIIETSADFDRAFRSRYLSHHIRYPLGSREKAGIDAFRRLLVQHQFSISPDPPEYV